MLVNDPVTQARLDLTTALRTAARHGLNEGVCNHFSMAVPGREELFLSELDASISRAPAELRALDAFTPRAGDRVR